VNKKGITMAWLNYHHLMYFKTIATEGSISKASEKLLVGQPALSSQLKNLEESFGQALFERKNRKLVLTEAGKAALKYANEIFSLGQELTEVLKDQSFTLRPHVKVGAMDSIPKSLVVKLIQEIRKFDQCKVTAIDGSGEELLRHLLASSLDLAITNHHLLGQESDKIVLRSIGKAPIGVYGHEKYKYLKRNFPHSLNGEEVILPTPHSKLRHDVEHFFQENKILCKLFVDTQDTAVQKLLATNGLGLIVEPDFAAKPYIKEKKIIKLGMLPGVYEEYFLVSAQRTIENPVAEHVMKNFSPKVR
tara:strand:+ start:9199 stop:10110 length:912 start_codon:yes stop_codon:yes gene_type:complete